jgi:serine/threonine-protein kinase
VLNEQIGQYRITGRLGQGGMGEIFAAHDEKLNRTVAVKFIANAVPAAVMTGQLIITRRSVISARSSVRTGWLSM